MEETGWLRVFVAEASGTIPVAGAFVTISEYEPGTEGNVIRLLTTGRDGLTETVGLPAPPASDSTSPGEVSPGAVYAVRVRKAGYYPVEAAGVPVFAGIVSLQAVDLQPIGAFAGTYAGNQVQIYETPETESLEPGGLNREDIGSRNGILSGGLRSGSGSLASGDSPAGSGIPGSGTEGGGA